MDHREQLRRQLRFLSTSCHQYDSGNHEEAVRLAASISMIFHDTAQSTSLLRHLGMKHVEIRSSCVKYPKDWKWWPIPNLTSIYLNPHTNAFECFPNLGSTGGHRFILASQWWNEIINRRGQTKMSRKDIVQDARNKDGGGGHVADKHTERYSDMVEGGGWKIVNKPNGSPEITLSLQNVHLATLRQLAYEVLTSPQLLKIADLVTAADSNAEDPAEFSSILAESTNMENRGYRISFGHR